eukprot:jgi/Mesvir1/14325/Mv09738-RA.1
MDTRSPCSYSRARAYDATGVWQQWLNAEEYTQISRYLESAEAWNAFLKAGSSEAREQNAALVANDPQKIGTLCLQLRARALLYDTILDRCFQSDDERAAEVPLLDVAAATSQEAELRLDAVFHSLEADREDWDALEASGSRALLALKQRTCGVEQTPEKPLAAANGVAALPSSQRLFQKKPRSRASRELSALMPETSPQVPPPTADEPGPTITYSKDDPGAPKLRARLTSALQTVLTELQNMGDISAPFLQKVKKSEAYDYHDVIKKPMDLGTMSKKLKAGKYAGKSAFAADVDLIVRNCRQYNEKGSLLVKHANTLGQRAIKLLKVVPNIEMRTFASNTAKDAATTSGNALAGTLASTALGNGTASPLPGGASPGGPFGGVAAASTSAATDGPSGAVTGASGQAGGGRVNSSPVAPSKAKGGSTAASPSQVGKQAAKPTGTGGAKVGEASSPAASTKTGGGAATATKPGDKKKGGGGGGGGGGAGGGSASGGKGAGSAPGAGSASTSAEGGPGGSGGLEDAEDEALEAEYLSLLARREAGGVSVHKAKGSGLSGGAARGAVTASGGGIGQGPAGTLESGVPASGTNVPLGGGAPPGGPAGALTPKDAPTGSNKGGKGGKPVVGAGGRHGAAGSSSGISPDVLRGVCVLEEKWRAATLGARMRAMAERMPAARGLPVAEWPVLGQRRIPEAMASFTAASTRAHAASFCTWDELARAGEIGRGVATGPGAAAGTGTATGVGAGAGTRAGVGAGTPTGQGSTSVNVPGAGMSTADRDASEAVSRSMSGACTGGLDASTPAKRDERGTSAQMAAAGSAPSEVGAGAAGGITVKQERDAEGGGGGGGGGVVTAGSMGVGGPDATGAAPALPPPDTAGAGIKEDAQGSQGPLPPGLAVVPPARDGSIDNSNNSDGPASKPQASGGASKAGGVSTSAYVKTASCTGKSAGKPAAGITAGAVTDAAAPPLLQRKFLASLFLPELSHAMCSVPDVRVSLALLGGGRDAPEGRHLAPPRAAWSTQGGARAAASSDHRVSNTHPACHDPATRNHHTAGKVAVPAVRAGKRPLEASCPPLLVDVRTGWNADWGVAAASSGGSGEHGAAKRSGTGGKGTATAPVAAGGTLGPGVGVGQGAMSGGGMSLPPCDGVVDRVGTSHGVAGVGGGAGPPAPRVISQGGTPQEPALSSTAPGAVPANQGGAAASFLPPGAVAATQTRGVAEGGAIASDAGGSGGGGVAANLGDAAQASAAHRGPPGTPGGPTPRPPWPGGTAPPSVPASPGGVPGTPVRSGVGQPATPQKGTQAPAVATPSTDATGKPAPPPSQTTVPTSGEAQGGAAASSRPVAQPAGKGMPPSTDPAQAAPVAPAVGGPGTLAAAGPGPVALARAPGAPGPLPGVKVEEGGGLQAQGVTAAPPIAPAQGQARGGVALPVVEGVPSHAAEVWREQLRRAVAKVAGGSSGYEAVRRQALEVLTDVAARYMGQLGATLRVLVEEQCRSSSAASIMEAAVSSKGHSSLAGLSRYMADGVAGGRVNPNTARVGSTMLSSAPAATTTPAKPKKPRPPRKKKADTAEAAPTAASPAAGFAASTVGGATAAASSAASGSPYVMAGMTGMAAGPGASLPSMPGTPGALLLPSDEAGHPVATPTKGLLKPLSASLVQGHMQSVGSGPAVFVPIMGSAGTSHGSFPAPAHVTSSVVGGGGVAGASTTGFPSSPSPHAPGHGQPSPSHPQAHAVPSPGVHAPVVTATSAPKSGPAYPLPPGTGPQVQGQAVMAPSSVPWVDKVTVTTYVAKGGADQQPATHVAVTQAGLKRTLPKQAPVGAQALKGKAATHASPDKSAEWGVSGAAAPSMEGQGYGQGGEAASAAAQGKKRKAPAGGLPMGGTVASPAKILAVGPGPNPTPSPVAPRMTSAGARPTMSAAPTASPSFPASPQQPPPQQHHAAGAAGAKVAVGPIPMTDLSSVSTIGGMASGTNAVAMANPRPPLMPPFHAAPGGPRNVYTFPDSSTAGPEGGQASGKGPADKSGGTLHDGALLASSSRPHLASSPVTGTLAASNVLLPGGVGTPMLRTASLGIADLEGMVVDRAITGPPAVNLEPGMGADATVVGAVPSNLTAGAASMPASSFPSSPAAFPHSVHVMQPSRHTS